MVHISALCKDYFVHKLDIGVRLKEERERLGFVQTQFAAIGNASKRAQINYEQGISSPDANYLCCLGKVGVDVQFIVTGERRGGGLGESAVHHAVMEAVELLSLEKKINADQLANAVVKLCLKTTASPQMEKIGVQNLNRFEGSQQNFENATITNVAGRDIRIKSDKA